MQLYLRITYLGTGTDPHLTILIPTDDAGHAAVKAQTIFNQAPELEDKYFIRHELIDERTLTYLLFEPEWIHEYIVYDNLETQIDNEIVQLAKKKNNSDRIAEEFANYLEDFREKVIRSI